MSTLTVLSNRYRWMILLTLLCLASRLLFLGIFLEDWDSVDFALALQSYNIKIYQPHFPGYPVYIFLSWLCNRLLHNPVSAVILPGAMLGALTILPLYGLAQRLGNQRIATLTALLYLVNPACWLQAEKAFSDASGLCAVVGALYLCWRASEADAKPYHLFYGSLLLGVGLGIRLSYAPMLLSWVALLLHLAWRQPKAYTRRCSDGCYGLLIGICLWLAPQLALTGGLELLYDGLAFTSQHFAEWGGTIVSSAALEHQQWGYRLLMFFWGLWAYGLGGWWPDTSLLRLVPSVIMLGSFGLGCLSARWGNKTGFVLLYGIPYGLWTFLGQHADQPRHLLPLLPLLLILLATGLEHLMRLSEGLLRQNIARPRQGDSGFSPTPGSGVSSTILCALLLVTLGGVSVRLLIIHRLTPPPRLQVLQYMVAHFEPQSTRLYAWGTRRMFAFYAPNFDVSQCRDLPAARRHLDASASHPSSLFVTSDVAGVAGSPDVQLVQLFQRDRYVHNPHWQQGLYRWLPPGMSTSQACQGCAVAGQTVYERR